MVAEPLTSGAVETYICLTCDLFARDGMCVNSDTRQRRFLDSAFRQSKRDPHFRRKEHQEPLSNSKKWGFTAAKAVAWPHVGASPKSQAP